MFILCLPHTVGHSFIVFFPFPKLLFTLYTVFSTIRINKHRRLFNNNLNQSHAEVP